MQLKDAPGALDAPPGKPTKQAPDSNASREVLQKKQPPSVSEPRVPGEEARTGEKFNH